MCTVVCVRGLQRNRTNKMCIEGYVCIYIYIFPKYGFCLRNKSYCLHFILFTSSSVLAGLNAYHNFFVLGFLIFFMLSIIIEHKATIPSMPWYQESFFSIIWLVETTSRHSLCHPLLALFLPGLPFSV